jgi:hypothetical protein
MLHEDDAGLLALMRAIAARDVPGAQRALAQAPALAVARLTRGATRAEGERYLLREIGQHMYEGGTALHVAAAHCEKIVQDLLGAGADVHARDRRGAEPIHLAAMGSPGSHGWDASAQSGTIARLLRAGADPNAADKRGVTPLHRAVRTRCAAAVTTLLDGGADPSRKSSSGSTPMGLATRPTGRGGSGSADAKAQQESILAQLRRRGAAP